MKRRTALIIVLALILAPCLDYRTEAEAGSDLQGLWEVGGFIENRWVYDIHDSKALEELYNSTWLWFDEDERFQYGLNVFLDEGTYAPLNDNSYILRKESGSRLTCVDDVLVIESTGEKKGTYTVEMLGDGDTLIFGQMDPMTGKVKADDTPLLFVRSGADSSYIAQNKKKPGGKSDSASTSTPKSDYIPTYGEMAALKRAKEYLAVLPFSYTGLIEQLEFEYIRHECAVYAADNCDANWKNEAAKKATAYLEIFSFSRPELISQLEFDGFTHEEAVYGAEINGY